ncbi:MAG TPA: ion transporter [Leucothrix sp.]|nr:ion transporter [Leucothrix sp.]
MEKIRWWLYQVLEKNQKDFFSNLINFTLVLLIVLNVIVIIISSEKEILIHFDGFFHVFEIITLIIFTLEYMTRIWVSVEKNKKDRLQPLMSRLRYMLTPMSLIDLFAILPSYFLLFGTDLLVLRALRLIRVFKLTRYSSSMELLIIVTKQEIDKMLSAIFVLLILIVISATGIHIVEGDVQPEDFGSIPRALWWATVTLTTVGYGDVVPVTALGKTLGIIIVIIGIGMAALPAGILAAGFTSEISRRRERFKTAILAWLDDGTFDKHEKVEFVALRKELGVGRSDAALMIREARREIKMLRHVNYNCPKCGYDFKQR